MRYKILTIVPNLFLKNPAIFTLKIHFLKEFHFDRILTVFEINTAM